MFSLLLPYSAGQWQTVGYFFVLLIVLLGSAEIISRKLNLPQEFSRKFIHIVVGLLVFGFALNIHEMQPITFLSLLFTLVNAVVLKFNLMPSMGSLRKSYGTVFYPLTILVGAIALWEKQKIIFLSLVLVLALADAFAAMVGQNWKKPDPIIVLKDKKTLPGSLAMWGASTLVIFLLLLWNGTPLYYPLSVVALASGLFIAVAEMVSVDGSDNISIGITTVIILSVFIDKPPIVQEQFLWALMFGGLLGFTSFKLHFLDAGGALITFLIAVLVYGIGGWMWTIPILTFFFTASLLSKAGKSRKKDFTLLFEKNSNRDGFQVLANGGIAMLCVIVFFFYPQDILLYFFIVSLAAANADTWATELGVFSKSAPRLVTNFKKVAKGRSGAISLLGISGALTGAAIVAISLPLFKASEWNGTEILIISLTGLMASLVDSVLGAAFQVQYSDVQSGALTERPESLMGIKNKRVHGYIWLNNDWVNFISIASALLFYTLIRNLF